MSPWLWILQVLKGKAQDVFDIFLVLKVLHPIVAQSDIHAVLLLVYHKVHQPYSKQKNYETFEQKLTQGELKACCEG